MKKKGKTLTIVTKRQDDHAVMGSPCHIVETIVVDDVKLYHYTDSGKFLKIECRLTNDTFKDVLIENNDVDYVEITY